MGDTANHWRSGSSAQQIIAAHHYNRYNFKVATPLMLAVKSIHNDTIDYHVITVADIEELSEYSINIRFKTSKSLIPRYQSSHAELNVVLIF